MSEDGDFVFYCKSCQKVLKDHDEAQLNKCMKMRELGFWKKE